MVGSFKHPNIFAALRAFVDAAATTPRAEPSSLPEFATAVSVMEQDKVFAERLGITRHTATSSTKAHPENYINYYLHRVRQRSPWYSDMNEATSREYEDLEAAHYASSITMEASLILLGIRADCTLQLDTHAVLRPLQIRDIETAQFGNLGSIAKVGFLNASAVVSASLDSPIVSDSGPEALGDAAAQLQEADLTGRAQAAADRLRLAVSPPPVDIFGYTRCTDWLFDRSFSMWKTHNPSQFVSAPHATFYSDDQTRLDHLFRILDPRRNALEVAVRRYSHAAHRIRPDDAIVDCSIALEALLTNPLRADLSFRLALFGALLAEDEPRARLSAFERLRDLYKSRSNLVHGSIANAELSDERDQVADLTRRIILRAAESLPPPDARPDPGTKGHKHKPRLNLDQHWVHLLFSNIGRSD